MKSTVSQSQAKNHGKAEVILPPQFNHSYLFVLIPQVNQTNNDIPTI